MAKTVKEIMTKKLVTVSYNDDIKNAIAKMDQFDVKELPLVDEHGNLKGMITYYDILDAIKADPNEKVHTIAIMPPTVTLETPIEEVATKMLHSGVEALPVLEGQKIIGIISDYDMVKEIVNYETVRKLKVKDVMRPAENIIKKNEPLSAARRLMRFHGIDRIPVVDEEGRSIGLVISIDILRKFLKAPKEKMGEYDAAGAQSSMFAMPVEAVMRTDIPEIYLEDTVPAALEKLMEVNLKGAQVVDKEGKVVGLFHRWDLLNKISEQKFEDGVWLNFSGLQLKVDTLEVLKNYLASDIKKIKRLAPDAKSIDVHIRKLHGASEDKWNFEVNVSLTKNSGNREIVSKGPQTHYGYNLMFTLSDALNKLSGQLEKKHQKSEGKQNYAKGTKGRR